MKRVFKYPIPQLSDFVNLAMPAGAKILSVQRQIDPNDQTENEMHHTKVWALVDDRNMTTLVTRRLRVAGTGQPIVDPVGDAQFIGTVQYFDGAQTRHFFDLGEVHK